MKLWAYISTTLQSENKVRIMLKVENLSVSYDEKRVVSNISFELEPRDVLVVLGPNGAGKTTLLRAILNLIPHEGKVSWETKKISYLPPQEFLQRKNLPPLSVEDFFSFKNASNDDIKQMLIEVGLDPEIMTHGFNELSTGQFQRMLIAWALIDNPDVLIFDEPTSGIDIGGEETIYTLLHKFWESRQLSIILVTHDLNIVWEHASRVICLNEKMTCMGRPEEVLTPEKLKALYGTGLKYYEHNHNINNGGEDNGY